MYRTLSENEAHILLWLGGYWPEGILLSLSSKKQDQHSELHRDEYPTVEEEGTHGQETRERWEKNSLFRSLESFCQTKKAGVGK